MDPTDHKKINLEELSKDDLLKRYKGLVILVQKIKASKAELEEENNTLKGLNEEQSKTVSQEIVDKFTEEKLFFVSEINDLKEKNNYLKSVNINLEKDISSFKELQEKYNWLETENSSYCRQISRLTEENEQLFTDLSTLEIQISELNKLGKQQQEELLQLEKKNETNLTDLQSKLSEMCLENEALTNKLLSKEHEVIQLSIELENLKSKSNSTSDNICVKNTEDLEVKIDSDSKKLLESQKQNKNLKDKLKCYHTKLKKFALNTKEIKEQKNEIIKNFKAYIIQIKEWKEQLYIASNNLVKVINNLETENKVLKEYKEDKIKELSDQLLLHQIELKSLNEEIFIKEKKYKEDIDKLNMTLRESLATEKQLAVESSSEILRLKHSNKNLEDQITQMTEMFNKGNKSEISTMSQTDDNLILLTSSGPTSNENGINLKRENSELLHEMNQMNQVLKERGEIISKLEVRCEEITKKLQFYEAQANKSVDSITEKDGIIKKLTLENESLKNMNIKKDFTYISTNTCIPENSYVESDTMSTSTISRTDESNRLKEFEGPWEERYGKLRTLAIKLKSKVKEQSGIINQLESEREDLQQKLSNNLKTIQNLQNEIDTQQDKFNQLNVENKKYITKLNSVAETISKDKLILVEKDELAATLYKEIEQLNNEKKTVEAWKKQISSKVQTLRKELEAKNLVIKSFESKVTKLELELEIKGKELLTEQENHKQTRDLLDETTSISKKNSVLNLEMKDYEKTVKELLQKIDQQTSDIENLQSQLDIQKMTVSALKEQTKTLEGQREENEQANNSFIAEIDAYRKKEIDFENIVQQKERQILDLTKAFQSAKSENEELSTELSKVIADNQKFTHSLKYDRDQLRNHVSSLQQSLREASDKLILKEDELRILKDDYETYKVRAQSVLKKNHTRDLGLEEKLSEEVTTIKSYNSEIQNELQVSKEHLHKANLNNEQLTSENNKLLKKCQELQEEIEELKCHYDKLSEKHQTSTLEHSETIRNLKVHAETLAQCYRQKLSEQEMRHNREIIEIQSHNDKPASPVETTLVHPNMLREEGEGSENTDSVQPSKVYPVPLERLLSSKTDEETNVIKKQVLEQESKVLHLTALLSDTEQDLAKHVQMNKLLKEEIRRHQRSLEREQHAENLEYLKNVVFKFLTLNSGDERSRLVPVLNTILKLSPEETQKINMVAKGDPGIKAWASYLPLWSPNKPQ